VGAEAGPAGHIRKGDIQEFFSQEFSILPSCFRGLGSWEEHQLKNQ
jgi:hypothetical protein